MFTKDFKTLHKYYYLYSKTDSLELKNKLLEDISILESQLSIVDYEREEKVYNAYRKRLQRLKKRVSIILNSNKAIFLTLTFNDKTLAQYDLIFLKTYVRKFLKSQCSNYVCNVDYGSLNNRLHFHALVVPKNDLIDYNLYSLGAINGRKVYCPNSTRLSRYILKLSYHAIKDSTDNNRLIYSR